jgi:putative hydrolase of the HAD superfamily
MKKYKHLFFDLDHTLLDTNAIAAEALLEIYEELSLVEQGIDTFDRFHIHYSRINGQYWARYHNHKLPKERLRLGRFVDTLRYFGVDNTALAAQISQLFQDKTVTKPYLLPHAIDTLQYLHLGYGLHIITNGMSDVQYIKLERTGLAPFFTHIIISDEIGTQKPHKGIFEHAMRLADTDVTASLMIGDNLNTDIQGARAVGMDQVYYNPSGERHHQPATYEITDLAELKTLL